MRSLSLLILAVASLSLAHRDNQPQPSGAPSNPNYQPWCCPRESGRLSLHEQTFENGKVYCTYKGQEREVECKYNRITGDQARRQRRHNNDDGPQSACPCHASLNPALESKLPAQVKRHNRDKDSDDCDTGNVNNPLRTIINNSDKQLEPCPAPDPPQQCLPNGAPCPLDNPGACCSQACSAANGCISF